ncbi:UNVERIFIED_CONTAM: hypothetical protein FKN15_063692 [Acipenser sinensis]
MATGRGKLFRNYRIGLEKTQSCRTQSVDTGSRALNKEDMPLQSSTKGPEATKSLPTELLFKILSYLDASSLLCVACVNNQFHELANSKGLQVAWEITVTDRKGIDTTIEQSNACFSDTTVTVYWNSTNWPYFNKIKMLQLHGVLRAPVNCPTPNSLPTELLFKILSYLDASSLLCVACVNNQFHELANSKPGWRSLLAKYDLSVMEPPTILGSDKLVKLLRLHPGLVVGIWRGQWSVAFFIASLHFHKLVERSILGSSVCPYAVPTDKPLTDDIDPEYGLHGYKLHISLHSAGNIFMSGQFAQLFCKKGHDGMQCQNVKTPYAVPTDKPLKDDIDPEYGLHGYKLHSAGNIFMSGQFAQLFCKKEYIRNESVRLMVISRNDISQHIAISGKIGTAWNADVLRGVVESCCMMSLTVLDEVQNPFWCVSTPVSMQLSTETSTSYDYMGEYYNIKYNDSEGQYIRNESVRLMVISRNDISQHIAISGKIGTAWNADVLGGVVESCCMMSLTVLDEVQNPFWCVSTPVSMQLSTETSTSYDYMGEYYNIKYNDSEGRVFMELVWLKEHEQFFLTSLVLYITTEKVNKHFRTKY